MPVVGVVNGPNQKIKEFIENMPEDKQQACWELYGFIMNTWPDVNARLMGAVTGVLADNPDIQKTVEMGLMKKPGG